MGTASAQVAPEFSGPVTLPAVHHAGDEDVELTIVTMAFDASDPDALLGVLAKYVVLTRGHVGCRNVDLAASATRPGRYVIVQKWDSPAAQQAHFDSDDMVEMATACRPLLARPPSIDLLEPVTAHDLA
jgi:quinol monooxygenase YgiN